jgi:hypothetical protein
MARKRKRSPSPPPDPPDFILSRSPVKPFILVAKPSLIQSIRKLPEKGSTTEALLDFLFDFGFDSRVGLISCAPSVIGGSHCILVSLRLVSWIAAAVLPSHHVVRVTDFKKECLRGIEMNFFPRDASQEIKRLATLRLPVFPMGLLSSADVSSDIKALDAEVVGRFWAQRQSNSTVGELSPTASLALRSKLQRRANSSRFKSGFPRGKGAFPSLGCPLPLENVDEISLDSLLTHMGATPRSPGEHVGLKWKPVGALIRSSVEILYDSDNGFDVGAAEVAEGSIVPLPDISIDTGVFCILLQAPQGQVKEWLNRTPEAQTLLKVSGSRVLLSNLQSRELVQELEEERSKL